MIKSDYYPTVAIAALVRVLNDPSARQQKKFAVDVLVHVFDEIKDVVRVEKFLPYVLPTMLDLVVAHVGGGAASTTEAERGDNTVDKPSLESEDRTWPLKKLSALVSVVKDAFRPFIRPVLAKLAPCWRIDSETSDALLELISIMCERIRPSLLKLYVPALLEPLLRVLDDAGDGEYYDEDGAGASHTVDSRTFAHVSSALRALSSLKESVGHHLYLVIPTLLKIVDSPFETATVYPLSVRIESVKALRSLVRRCDGISEYASHLIFPLARTLQDCVDDERSREVCSSASRSVELLPCVNDAPVTEEDEARNMDELRALFNAAVSTLHSLAYRLEEEFVVHLACIESALYPLRAKFHDIRVGSGIGDRRVDTLRLTKPSALAAHGLTEEDVGAVDAFLQTAYAILRGTALPKPTWCEDGRSTVASWWNDDAATNKNIANREYHMYEQTSSFAASGSGVAMDYGDGNRRPPPAWQASVVSEALRRPTNEMASNSRTSRDLLMDTLRAAEDKSTEDDWVEWFRNFSLDLLRWSPSSSLCVCGRLAEVHASLGDLLFRPSFAAMYADLSMQGDGGPYVDRLVKTLRLALESSSLPYDILSRILDLAEFMDHDDKPLPVDVRVLGFLSQKVHSYATALHYKETEFRSVPNPDVLGELVTINRNLDAVEAAIGVVEYAKGDVRLGKAAVQPRWYAELGRWRDALEAYAEEEEDADDNSSSLSLDVVATKGLRGAEMESALGKLACYKALGEWSCALDLCERQWNQVADLRVRALKENGVETHSFCGNLDFGSAPVTPAASNADTPRGEAILSMWVVGGATPDSALASDDREDEDDDRASKSNKPTRWREEVPGDFERLPAAYDSRPVTLLVSSEAGPVRPPGAAPGAEDRADPDTVYGDALRDYDRGGPVHRFATRLATSAAYAAWASSRWSEVAKYVRIADASTFDGMFLRAVLATHRSRYADARKAIEAAYANIAEVVCSLVKESYSRAYSRVVHLQELAELKEIVDLRSYEHESGDTDSDRKRTLRRLWRQRLDGVQQSADVLLPLLAVRSMVLNPRDDAETWLKFAKVCRKQNRATLSLKALLNLGVYESDEQLPSSDSDDAICDLVRMHGSKSNIARLFPQYDRVEPANAHPEVAFAYAKHLWAFGDQGEALKRLRVLAEELHEALIPNNTPSVSLIGSPAQKTPTRKTPVPSPVALVGGTSAASSPASVSIATKRRLLQSTTLPKRDRHTSVGRSKLGLVKVQRAAEAAVDEEEDESDASSNSSASNSDASHSSDADAVRVDDRSSSSSSSSSSEDDASFNSPSVASSATRSKRAPSSAIASLSVEEKTSLAVRASCKVGEWLLKLSLVEEQRAQQDAAALVATVRAASRAVHHSPKGSPDALRMRKKKLTKVAGSFVRRASPKARVSLSATIKQVVAYYARAVSYDTASYRTWHLLALGNYQAVEIARGSGEHVSREDDRENDADAERLVNSALESFIRAIRLGRNEGASVLQDTLRVVELWFNKDQGHKASVRNTLKAGFEALSVDVWLDVIPQLIARVDAPTDLVVDLLNRVGETHPQVLIYPLTVATKSESIDRSRAAAGVMAKMTDSHPRLVDEALLVSEELIRIAVLWHESWHEGLEEASAAYFSPKAPDVAGMLRVLAPLHACMADGAETLHEVGFVHAYGRDLREAHEWLAAHEISNDPAHLNQAWDLYYGVFRGVSKNLKMKSLELRHVSPRLLSLSHLQLAVPGTYLASGNCVKIDSFHRSIRVIISKQRPRVVSMAGSDGRNHAFLLKGHEDIRLDERVMQLFGLVNDLLASDPETSKQDVYIKRYAVVPLSNRVGVMEWVPACDTLHELVRSYRESRRVHLNVEQRLLASIAPDFEQMTLVQKVEAYEFVLSQTSGRDLARIMWLKAPNAEHWLERRTNYTRSLAAMSMVGYLLGLGDRHPSNLMLERASGRILHIDFGDCFEVAQKRDKFPEYVPFRLTRMLISAMEASGIEGNFRVTCESVMRVLRDSRESVSTMLEAFVYDPLITWYLFKSEKDGTSPTASAEGPLMNYESSEHTPSSLRTCSAVPPLDYAAAASRRTNPRALEIVERVKSKLRGTDFSGAAPDSTDEDEKLDVVQQVDRLIEQATSSENLVRLYLGWCSFW